MTGPGPVDGLHIPPRSFLASTERRPGRLDVKQFLDHVEIPFWEIATGDDRVIFEPLVLVHVRAREVQDVESAP